MATKVIDSDEWYPVYTIEEPNPSFVVPVVEVSEDLMVRYNRIMEEFGSLQRELRALDESTRATTKGR